MSVIPQHSVVFILGGSNEALRETVLDHELITREMISSSLVGKSTPPSLDVAISRLVETKMRAKLALGERVFFDGRDHDSIERIRLAKAAYDVGATVIYLIDSTVTDEQQRRGDGVAEVINSDLTKLTSPRVFPTESQLIQSHKGITVVGDVHGMLLGLQSAIAWARSRNHFLLFVGDILDYGVGSLDVVDEVYRLVMRGDAELILGNHERKIMRWLNGQKARLSDGNRVTTHALAALGVPARKRWEGLFRALYERSRLVREIGTLVVAHAAIHPSFWNEPQPDLVEQFAFFGEVDGQASTAERFVRSYRWCSLIPQGRTVVVGHDARSRFNPLSVGDRNTGTAIFLDTGSGKGGHLSTADFRFTETGLRLECFNFH